jgi:hypothetical protein
MIGLFQPEGGRRLSTHPITDKLVMAVNFANQDHRSGAGSVTAIVPEDTGIAGRGSYLQALVAYDVGQNRYGKWVGFDVATINSSLSWSRSDFVPTTAATVLMLYEKADSTNRSAIVFGVDYALGSITNSCNCHAPWNDGIVYWDWGGNTNGVTRVQASGLTLGADRWVFTVGARGMEIWQNGIKRASNAATPTRNKDATMAFKLGATPSGSGVTNDIAHFNLYAMWTRQLTTEEVLMVSADPYMLCEDGSTSNIIRSAMIGQSVTPGEIPRYSAQWGRGNVA